MKFKVGDRVRVVEWAGEYKIGQELIITKVNEGRDLYGNKTTYYRVDGRDQEGGWLGKRFELISTSNPRYKNHFAKDSKS